MRYQFVVQIKLTMHKLDNLFSSGSGSDWLIILSLATSLFFFGHFYLHGSTHNVRICTYIRHVQ